MHDAQEALLLGSLIVPALEAVVSILKSRIPKKPLPEVNQKILLPVRDFIKKQSVRFEAVKNNYTPS